MYRWGSRKWLQAAARSPTATVSLIRAVFGYALQVLPVLPQHQNTGPFRAAARRGGHTAQEQR